MLWLAWHFWLYGAAGFRDETLSAYTPPDAVYQLVEMNGQPAPVRVTLWIPSFWHIAWQTPCGQYRAKLMVPYPWFDLSAVRQDNSTCATGQIDELMRQVFETSTLVETLNHVMILTQPDGSETVFHVQP